MTKRVRQGQVLALLAVAALALAMTACGEAAPPPMHAGLQAGDPDRGEAMLADYGCTACHSIPGIAPADAFVGPPLTAWSERSYIAGRLPNTPDNLIRWIMSPQEVDPGNAMPDMGVPEPVARDIAAYLYTLSR